MIKRYGVAIVGILLFILFSIDEADGQGNDVGKIKCICIDAGHGGKDPGAIGGKTYEKHIVLKVVLKLGETIKKTYPDIKVIYTRDRDVFVDLKDRTKLANDSKADLFMSIHANSVTNKGVKGIETFVLGSNSSAQNLQVAMKENAVIRYEDDYSVKYDGFDPSKAESYIIFNLIQNMHLEKSLSIASCVQNELIKKTQRVDREVRQAPLWVLKDASMPSILIELGFISNPDEENFMMSAGGQEKLVTSIFRGFQDYKAKVEKNSILLHKDAPVKQAVEKDSDETIVEQKLFYAVQIASAKDKITDKASFGIEEEVKMLLTDGRYRYYVGYTDNYREAKDALARVKKTIRDCFIIAVHRGNLISLNEARALESKNE